MATHRQRHWHQAVERALLILDRLKQRLPRKDYLDRHSAFDIRCILSDCYSKIGALDKADAILEEYVLPHTLWNGRNDRNDWNEWKLYLEYLCRAKRWTKGYELCSQQFAANNTEFQFDAAMSGLNELFTLKQHQSSRQFVTDAVLFGNQCRIWPGNIGRMVRERNGCNNGNNWIPRKQTVSFQHSSRSLTPLNSMAAEKDDYSLRSEFKNFGGGHQTTRLAAHCISR